MADATGRTERATPRRREEARKLGQVVLSPEVAPVAALVAALAMAELGAPGLLRQARLALASWLAAIGPTAAHDDPVGPLVWRATVELLAVLAPFFVVVAVAGIGAVVAQVGWHPNPALVAPDPERISLTRGWKRIVSPHGVASLVKAIAKIAIVLGVAHRVVLADGAAALGAASLPVEGIVGFAGASLARVGIVMALALVVVAAADYAWTRWRHEQSLKMSRHELREEQKQSEGDPQVRLRFRRAHREIARRRMLAEVARADVVLVSPMHVAVALRYRADESRAARVLAKGAGALCEKIERAARDAGVPVVERRALARAAFRTVRVGGEIPPALYRAVAEILAYVYSRRDAGAAEAR
jgi:flagellar biosynthetic protein FlhB